MLRAWGVSVEERREPFLGGLTVASLLPTSSPNTPQAFINSKLRIAGEYARDEDGDGFYEVHVNTMEGFWSLLRSWLRPHRGISQAHLPIYLGFFEFVHNAKKRGKALLSSLLELIIS